MTRSEVMGVWVVRREDEEGDGGVDRGWGEGEGGGRMIVEEKEGGRGRQWRRMGRRRRRRRRVYIRLILHILTTLRYIIP